MTNREKIIQISKELNITDNALLGRIRINYSKWSPYELKILSNYGGFDKIRNDYNENASYKRKRASLGRKISKILYLSESSVCDKMKNNRRHFTQDELRTLSRTLNKEEIDFLKEYRKTAIKK